uniref:Lectin subunit alpha n=1 Tax=Magallana gigas TaxID=29159 RepID=K1QEP9_MAGGI
MNILDCGIPVKRGLDLSKTKREDAIGIHRRIHASCSNGYFQFGSGRLICQSNGEWKYNIHCEDRAWTGGRYETKKMYFIWSESGEKVNYTNWNPPNPDIYRNQEHFIQMLDCGRWNDNNCNQKLPYICEKKFNV